MSKLPVFRRTRPRTAGTLYSIVGTVVGGVVVAALVSSPVRQLLTKAGSWLWTLLTSTWTLLVTDYELPGWIVLVAVLVAAGRLRAWILKKRRRRQRKPRVLYEGKGKGTTAKPRQVERAMIREYFENEEQAYDDPDCQAGLVEAERRGLASFFRRPLHQRIRIRLRQRLSDAWLGFRIRSAMSIANYVMSPFTTRRLEPADIERAVVLVELDGPYGCVSCRLWGPDFCPECQEE